MIITRAGVAQRLTYDDLGRLASVTDDAGRVLAFEYKCIEAQGAPAEGGAPAPKQNLDRISKVSVRGTDGGHHLVGEYGYDAEGDLVAARDALGHAYRFEYVNHLLVKETDKNGLSFYFQYDGIDASAKCIRTWGDGGIYDHVITYDAAKRITLVENSLGESTLYQMDEAGQVVSVTDAAGRVTRYAYDEESGQVSQEIDPAGGVAAREYDERGNLTRHIAPDGASIALEYNTLDLPEHVVDALGHDWRWQYDLEGQLTVRRTAPRAAGSTTASRGCTPRSIRAAIARHEGATRSAASRSSTSRTAINGRSTTTRRATSSSKGFEQTIVRNSMGDVLSIEAGVHSLPPSGASSSATPLAQGPYRVSFERDRLGLELERRLPGGVRARWQRDALGRPITHEIAVGGALHSLRQYKWEPNDRLKSVIDSLRGPTNYSHDAFGNLASAVYADGHVDLRLPDAVGNSSSLRTRRTASMARQASSWSRPTLAV